MNFEKSIECKSEKEKSKDFVEILEKNFNFLDLDKQIPIVVESGSSDSGAKACFYYDKEGDGEDLKMINKKYIIFKDNVNKIEDSEKLPLSIAIHEIRHRAQNESEYQKELNQLELFSIDLIEKINDSNIKKLLIGYINDLPETVKNSSHELDAKITEMIFSNLFNRNLIELKEIKDLLNMDATQILDFLITKHKETSNSSLIL